jgi:hypothetical protein
VQKGVAEDSAGTILLTTMDHPTQHFADDPDVLEQFVLGHLDQTTTAEHEKHLHDCEHCREAVRAERIIAAGIKRHGRDQLKQRLGMLAGMPATRKIPWPHLLSAAAVLAILVGIGITQHWFVSHVAPTEAAKALKTEQPTPPPPEPAITQRSGGELQRSEANDAKVKDHDAGYAHAPTDNLEKSIASESEDKRNEEMARPLMAPTSVSREFWATGTVIPALTTQMAIPEGGVKKSLMEKEAQPRSTTQSEMKTPEHITLEQRPASMLPARLLNQLQSTGPRTIQTLVRQSRGETYLTLYPETPFDSTEFHLARIRQVSADSLLVFIGNQRIGYRLPADVLAPKGATVKDF